MMTERGPAVSTAILWNARPFREFYSRASHKRGSTMIAPASVVALIPSSGSRRHALIRALPLAAGLACALSLSSPVFAASFDGSWSVLIITRSGPCGQSYRYGVTISNGVISGAGGASVVGRVSQNGSVSVSVSAPQGRARGSGKLSRNSGGGSWSGSGPSGSCSGSWSARRG